MDRYDHPYERPRSTLPINFSDENQIFAGNMAIVGQKYGKIPLGPLPKSIYTTVASSSMNEVIEVRAHQTTTDPSVPDPTPSPQPQAGQSPGSHIRDMLPYSSMADAPVQSRGGVS